MPRRRTLAAPWSLWRFHPFGRRGEFWCSRLRRYRRIEVLLVTLRAASTARETNDPDDGEGHARESDAVRDELRGIGEASLHADELPVDVEDPEVRALVSGAGRRQVELRVFGRAKGDVAVDFVLRDERRPNVSPQGVRLPGFRNERWHEDRGQAGARGARGGGERRGAEEGSTGDGGLRGRGPVAGRIRLRNQHEKRRVRRRDAVLGPEGRQFRDDAGIRPGSGGLQERMDSRQDPLPLEQRLDRNFWTGGSEVQGTRRTRPVWPRHSQVEGIVQGPAHPRDHERLAALPDDLGICAGEAQVRRVRDLRLQAPEDRDADRSEEFGHRPRHIAADRHELSPVICREVVEHGLVIVVRRSHGQREDGHRLLVRDPGVGGLQVRIQRGACRPSVGDEDQDGLLCRSASIQRSRNPMLPDASTRMTRARGVGRREEANVASAASKEKRTYRSPLESANWLKEVPAARNRMWRSPVAAGRVSLMYASARCNPPRIAGRSGWLGIWTSPRGAAVSTRACTRRYERLSRASMDRRYVYS